MRVLWLICSLFSFAGAASIAGGAWAGDINDRLNRLEYESRMQRLDTDMLIRQQRLDAQDAYVRAAQDREDRMIEELQRPLMPPPPGWERR